VLDGDFTFTIGEQKLFAGPSEISARHDSIPA
jgi:hypothetical protein